MRFLVYFVTLFWGFLFFSVTAIFGIAYNGSDDSRLFMYSSLAIIALFYLYYINDNLKGVSKKRNNAIFLLYVFLIIVAGVFTDYIDSSMFKQFTLFCLPATLLGFKYARIGSIAPMVKYLDCFVIILTVSFVFMMRNLAQLVGDGLAGYSQSMSYYASLTVLLNAFLLKYGHQYERYKIFSSLTYKIISWFLFIPQFLALIMGGGRGAFVVVVLGLAIITLRDVKKLSRVLVISTLIVTAFLFIIPKFGIFGIEGGEDVLSKNFERIIAAGQVGGDLYDRTSGRNVVYEDALNAIANNPFGYGMFAYEKQLPEQPYPHNIVLEWAMQWGVLYALFQIIFLIGLFLRFRRSLIRDELLAIFMPLLIYQFTLLLFSGSYMQEPLYWFSIAFMLNYDTKGMIVNKM